MSFFESLLKPDWVPPDWAFPTALFTLWTLQAGALVRLLQSGSELRTAALSLLIIQFVAAVLWPPFAFGPGRLLLAAIWLSVVLSLVVITTCVCLRSDRLAGLLVAPTIVWVSVATALAWSLYRLNPGA